ncbi:MAG: tRNA (N(6)-L-threonylcarbamoyladenosine(37)-C(2))-methylthiotransferase MtaB [Caulobacteraceae bacterium]|nr:tRNA (N(6)-L-threonylcarbamoyladenosine(37)-C(2))-methylthiotransferase MtaB [Caulobacter sp.]
MSVEVVTFGCRLNAYESGQARARAQADGLDDAVIVNTCAVTGEAVRQARQAIRRVRRERPGATLVVTGCAAQIDPQMFAAMPEVDAVVGNGLKSAPGTYAPAALAAEPVRVDAFARRSDPALPVVPPPDARARVEVEVQNGCDHACTFCVIPQGRGPSRSAPAGEVVARVEALARAGVPEVVLTGVDVTSWGADLPGRPTFGQLVGRVLRLVPELPRLRLSSIDAAEIDADLLRLFAEEERLMPHLHLSLQHGADLILKRMKRRHGRAQAAALVEAVRRARPDVAFGADLIAGFPTEDEAAFRESLSLVDELGLAFVHVFPFSPRPGTPAARMPPVERREVKARAARLREAADAALARHLARQVGREATVVVERPGLARAADFTEVAAASATTPGALMRLRLAGHDGRRAFA